MLTNTKLYLLDLKLMTWQFKILITDVLRHWYKGMVLKKTIPGFESEQNGRDVNDLKIVLLLSPQGAHCV